MLYFHLYYIIVLFPGQLRSLVKAAWDSPAHRANPRIHQCLLLELIHHFAVVMTNKTQVICFSSEPGKRDLYSMALAGMSLLNCRPLYHCSLWSLPLCVNLENLNKSGLYLLKKNYICVFCNPRTMFLNSKTTSGWKSNIVLG